MMSVCTYFSCPNLFNLRILGFLLAGVVCAVGVHAGGVIAVWCVECYITALIWIV